MAKIPDYGVQEHIAFVCATFFEGIESCSQYEHKEEEARRALDRTKLAAGDHQEPPPLVLGKGPRTRMSENPNQRNMGVDIVVSPNLDEI